MRRLRCSTTFLPPSSMANHHSFHGLQVGEQQGGDWNSKVCPTIIEGLVAGLHPRGPSVIVTKSQWQCPSDKEAILQWHMAPDRFPLAPDQHWSWEWALTEIFSVVCKCECSSSPTSETNWWVKLIPKLEDCPLQEKSSWQPITSHKFWYPYEIRT